MQLDFGQILALMAFVILLAVICFLAGAYVTFRARRTPGEGFFREPKGEVFTIPEAKEGNAFPDDLQEEERTILKRTEQFMEKLGGLKHEG